MKNKMLKSVIMDYYETVAYTLQYKPSEDMKKMTRRILEFLLKAQHLESSLDECLTAVESTDRICTVADIAIYDSSMLDRSEVDLSAYSFKVEMIVQMQLSRLSELDMDILLMRLEKDAALGQKNAAKLLACECWLGFAHEKNQKKAIEIWKTLAICGDRSATNLLIYALDSLGDLENALIWKNTRDAVDLASDAFSPFVLPIGEIGEISGKLEDKAKINAAIILAMSSTPRHDERQNIDRSLAYYLLYSEAPLEVKLEAIKGNDSCISRVYSESRFKNKKYGF